MNIYITGMGILSAIGKTVDETLHSLSEGKTGIGPIEYLSTVHKHEFVAGEVKYSNEELETLAGIGKYNRTTLLGYIAAKQAMDHAGIVNANDARTGFISSTTIAGMCYTELRYKDFFEHKTNENFFDSHFGGVSTDDIAQHLQIKVYVTTISTACSSAANAIMLGARLIKNNVLDRVVVGGVDPLSKFTLNGFNTLMILDKEWCRPFDNNRKGLNLGEGAAYLVIESERMVKRDKKKPLARLMGYGNANDAFHQTASSPDGQGAYLAMQKAFEVAGIEPSEIDYVNAHGTGTPNNDLSEGLAMQRIFNNNVPKFSSTKAFTGHTLAAAAAVEAVISVLAIQNNMIFPCLNRTTPMSDLTIAPVDVLEKNVPVNYVLSNSFGFGGNCSSLIFGKN
ncbi:MAG: beta-ketoacyl-[acyl-carrier-protein] synthase family protein [Bacteroidia bacterium]|jgi:3-oxoacyl-[acyl-carrier-protein] synthase-1